MIPVANMAPKALIAPSVSWAGDDSGNVTGRYPIYMKTLGANTFLSGSSSYAIWTNSSAAKGGYASDAGGSGPYYQLTADTWLIATNNGPSLGRINPDGSWSTVTTKHLPMDMPWQSWVYSPYRDELLYIGSDYAHGISRRAFTASVSSDSIGDAVTRSGIQDWYASNGVTTDQSAHPVAVDADTYLLIGNNGVGHLVNVAAGTVTRRRIDWSTILGGAPYDNNAQYLYDTYPYGSGRVLIRKESRWGDDGPESAIYAVLNVASGKMTRLSMPTAPNGWHFRSVWGDSNSLVDVYLLPNNQPVLFKFAMMTKDDNSSSMIYFQINDYVYYGGSTLDNLPEFDGMFGPPGMPFFKTGGFPYQQYVGVASVGGQYALVVQENGDDSYVILWSPGMDAVGGPSKARFM